MWRGDQFQFCEQLPDCWDEIRVEGLDLSEGERDTDSSCYRIVPRQYFVVRSAEIERK